MGEGPGWISRAAPLSDSARSRHLKSSTIRFSCHEIIRLPYHRHIDKTEVDMGNGQGKRVVVIGAGIVGASLAYHLASKGANVTLVEAEDIASGVTGSSFAWLNASHPEPDPIAQLRGSAIKEYRRLETQLPGLEIRWTGALSYSAMAIETLPVSGHQASANLVSRSRILDLEPNLKNPPQSALYAAEEGALDAVAATHVDRRCAGIWGEDSHSDASARFGNPECNGDWSRNNDRQPRCRYCRTGSRGRHHETDRHAWSVPANRGLPCHFHPLQVTTRPRTHPHIQP